MEALLASLEGKTLTQRRGEEVVGKVMLVTQTEIILDLGTKSEGIILKKDLPKSVQGSIQVGDKLTAFVATAEDPSGRTILSPSRQAGRTTTPHVFKKWDKFISAYTHKQILTGRVIEANKGGLVVEVFDMRGFLPTSQIGFSSIGNINELNGQDIKVSVIEVDPSSNRLVFTQRAQVSLSALEKLKKYTLGQKVAGSLVAIVPFGLFLNIDSLEGFVFKSEASWDMIDDLNQFFKTGELLEAQILEVDEALGRLILSIKRLKMDPFVQALDKYTTDDVVKGVVIKIADSGAFVDLREGVEGLIRSSKIESGTNYTIGQEVTCLVDSVDQAHRRINLVPLITTTKGLIYK